jgi:hypothetical protein
MTTTAMRNFPLWMDGKPVESDESLEIRDPSSTSR